MRTNFSGASGMTAMIVLLILLAMPSPVPADAIDLAMRAEIDAIRFEAPEQGGSNLEPQEQNVTRSKAFLRSLLVPGWGQHYAGNKTKSKLFLGVEAAIWTSFIVFKSREVLRTDEFEEHATAYADVDPAGKDEEYYRIMTIFNSSDEYNTAVRADARAIFGTAASDEKTQYIVENSYSGDREYRWKSNAERLNYRIIRNDARDSGQRADFALVAAVLNHAISAVEAARSTGSMRALQDAVGHIEVIPPASHEPPRLRFAWRTSF